MDEIYLLLDSLFKKAKYYNDSSEWEFIQTLLRDKYSNNVYTASQIISNEQIYESLFKEEKIRFKRQILEENIISVSSYIKVGNMLQDSFDDMIRIRLLTYSYITEIKYIQDIIANLLWISIGGNFYPDPFDSNIAKKMLTLNEIKKVSVFLGLDVNKYDTLRKSEKRFKLIYFLCEKAGIKPLKKYIESFYDNHFRNSIYHSKYFLSKDGYVGIDNNCEIKLTKEVLAEKIDKCIYFFISLINLLDEYNKQYCGIMSIKGRKINYETNNIEKNDIVDIDIVARKGGGLVSTIIRTVSKTNCKEEIDDFYNEFLKFTSEFYYNPNNDK